MDELLYKQAFKSHPYRWPVIGWMKDIKAVTQEKAVAFYKRFYAPNNAVLIIAGNIDPATTLDLIARHYGGIPAAEPPPPDGAQPERAPAGEVRAALTRPVPADRLVIGFPAPALGDRRSRRLRGRQRDPRGWAVVTSEPDAGRGQTVGLVGARRPRADARSRPARHLGADDEGSHAPSRPNA